MNPTVKVKATLALFSLCQFALIAGAGQRFPARPLAERRRTVTTSAAARVNAVAGLDPLVCQRARELSRSML